MLSIICFNLDQFKILLSALSKNTYKDQEKDLVLFFNRLPNDKIVDQSKLKILNIENVELNLLLEEYKMLWEKASISGSLKVRIVW